MGIGESLALAAASCWALSSIIYARAHLSAWNLNFAKNIIGGAIIMAAALIVGIAQNAVRSDPVKLFPKVRTSSRANAATTSP